MQRTSIIATVVATGGILVAGSVASVAVINAASSSAPESTTLALVSDEASVQPVAPPATESSSALPSLDASALPEIPTVDPAPAAAASSQPAQPQPQPQVTTVQARQSDDSSDSASTTRISADQARSMVLKQGDGTSVVSVSKDSRGGYSTWAVRITRASGEVITGYVDRASGVVVDWVVNQDPPTPTSPAKANASDDDREYAEDDDSEDDEDAEDAEDAEDDEDHDNDDD